MNTASAQQAPPPPQQQSPPVEYVPAPEEDLTAKLERLGALRAQGLLTDEEFTAAKQKLLAG